MSNTTMMKNPNINLKAFNALKLPVLILNQYGEILYKNGRAQTLLKDKENFLKASNSNDEKIRLTSSYETRSTSNVIHWTLTKNTEDSFLAIGEVQANEISSVTQNVLLSTIVNNLPDGIFWKDKNSKILGCNLVYANAAGFSKVDDVIGKTDYDLPWQAYADKYKEDDRQVIESGLASLTFEETNIQADGSEKTVLVSKVPLCDTENNIMGVIGIFKDITSHKELERVTKENELNKAVIEKLELLAVTLAHELRTPIAGIRTGLEGINRYLPKLFEAYKKTMELNLMPTIRKGQLQKLEDVSHRLSLQVNTCDNIINMQLRNLSIEKNNLPADETINIDTVVNNALLTFPMSKEDRQLINYHSEGDFLVKGSPDLLQHVIWNLVKNAIFYIRSENKGDIHIWFEKKQDFNYLHFKDTAKGIPKEYQEKIFERFFTRSLEGTGTGIGLTFVKYVMDNINGDVICKSIENEYAEFILKFPKVPS